MWETILIGLGCFVLGFVLTKLGNAWYKRALKTDHTKVDDYLATGVKWLGEALMGAVTFIFRKGKNGKK